MVMGKKVNIVLGRKVGDTEVAHTHTHTHTLASNIPPTSTNLCNPPFTAASLCSWQVQVQNLHNNNMASFIMMKYFLSINLRNLANHIDMYFQTTWKYLKTVSKPTEKCLTYPSLVNKLNFQIQSMYQTPDLHSNNYTVYK